MNADLPVWPRPRRSSRNTFATRRGGSDDVTPPSTAIPPLLRRALNALNVADVAVFARQLRLKETCLRQRALVDAAIVADAADFRLERIRICTALAFVDVAFNWSAALSEEVAAMHETRSVYQHLAVRYLEILLRDSAPVPFDEWELFHTVLHGMITPRDAPFYRFHYTHQTATKPVFNLIALLRHSEFSLDTWLDMCFRADDDALPDYLLNIAVVPIVGKPLAIPHLSVHVRVPAPQVYDTMSMFYVHDLRHSQVMEGIRWTDDIPWPWWIDRWRTMRETNQPCADYVMFLLLHELFTFTHQVPPRVSWAYQFADITMTQLMSFEPEETNDGSIRAVPRLDASVSKGVLELIFFMTLVKGHFVPEEYYDALDASEMRAIARYPSFYAQLNTRRLFVWKRRYRNNRNVSAALQALWRYVIEQAAPTPWTMYELNDNVPYDRIGEAPPHANKRKHVEN